MNKQKSIIHKKHSANHSANNQQQIECNYSNNYYGDQLCRVKQTTTGKH